jgi:transcription antitermination factor NusG
LDKNILQEGYLQNRVAPPEAPWYVIHTRSRHEAKVESALQQRGLEIFLPRVVIRSRRRDRKLLLEMPLFPGYLFVHTTLEHLTLYDIIKLKSVVRLLGGTTGPSPLSSETVDSIKTIINSDRPYYPGPYLKQGMKVRIVDGPLAGTVGIIQERRQKNRRLVVVVELFRRAVTVELEDEALDPWS